MILYSISSVTNKPFNTVQQSRQQALRAYSPNIYSVHQGLERKAKDLKRSLQIRLCLSPLFRKLAFTGLHERRSFGRHKKVKVRKFQKGILVTWCLQFSKISALEPVCCNKRQKIVPDQLLVLGIRASEGSEWYQTDPR